MERLLQSTGSGDSIGRPSEDGKAAIALATGPDNEALEPRDAGLYAIG